jgi:hypothetical protein
MRRWQARRELPKQHPTFMSHPIEPPPTDESPGVPGFRTWRGVYVFVFASFLLVVVLLAIFSRVYA